MSWLRRNWRWLLFFAVLLVGGIVILLLYATAQKRKADELRAQLAMGHAVTKVRGLQDDIEARAGELTVNKAAAAAVEKKLFTAQRAAVRIEKDVEKMSDMDIVKAYHDLGY